MQVTTLYNVIMLSSYNKDTKSHHGDILSSCRSIKLKIQDGASEFPPYVVLVDNVESIFLMELRLSSEGTTKKLSQYFSIQGV